MRDSLLLLLTVLALGVACTRGVWHGLDAYQFLRGVVDGQGFNDRHPLYPPICRAIAVPLHALGVGWFAGAAFASSLGIAIGVACMHRALLAFGYPRRSALALAIGIAACFGVFYWGTVIEIHGVFLAPAGLAWWLQARCERRPSAGRAAVTGAATVLAASVHATGHLLPLVFGAFVLVCGSGNASRRRWLVLLVLLFVVHWAGAAAVSTLAGRMQLEADPGLAGRPFDGAIRFVDRMFTLGTAWWRAPAILWREWLHPFLPASVLSLLALFVPATRRAAGVLLGCVAVYLSATVLLLAPVSTLAKSWYVPPFATIEYGAYFLPLVLPAVRVAAAALPWRSPWLLALLSVLVGGWSFATQDRVPGDLGYGRDAVAAIDADRARVIVGGYGEIDPIEQLRPGSDIYSIYALHVFVAGAPMVGREHVTGWFDVQYDETRAAGRPLWLTADALRLMRATPDGMFDHLADRHIPERYELVPLTRGRFQAFVVRRR